MSETNPRPAPEDEIEETLEPGPEDADPEHVAQQDFAARNVIMSNALQGGASPAAGGVIGSGGQLGMQPVAEGDDTDAKDGPPEEHDERSST